MRLPSLPTAVAAWLFCLVAVVPFLPDTHSPSDRFSIVARLASTKTGHVQLYYDCGRGLREEDSSKAPIRAGRIAQEVRLTLPPGAYPTLRFDPIDNDGVVTIESAYVATTFGRRIRDIPLRLFTPLNQIHSLREEAGRLVVTPTPGGDDPQLLLRFTPTLTLRTGWISLAADWGLRSLLLLVPLALLHALARRSTRAALGPSRLFAWLGAHPIRGIALGSLLAVLLSAFPVVFLGKSYVSPNMGTTLLYDGVPTLPGGTDARAVDVAGSDVGATLWEMIPYGCVESRSVLGDHAFPFWNRYNSGGTPLLGQGQSMVGDPLHLIVLAARGAAWAWDLKFVAAKWLLAFGAGLVVYRVSSHGGAAMIVSAAMPFIGFFLYRFNHPAIFSLCYAPWPLYCLLRYGSAGSIRAGAVWLGWLLAANLALLNSGTVKEAYTLLVTMNLAGGCAVLLARQGWSARAWRLAGLLGAAVLFLLIAAPFWYTFAATLAQAYTSYNLATAYQIQPALLLGLFDELFYRPLTEGGRVFNPSLNFLLLAGFLYYLATLRRHWTNRAALALGAVSLLPLGMAFGLMPPGWITALPFLGNTAHIDNSFSCALIILWSVLAGLGFAEAARRLGTDEGPGDLGVAALLLFGLVFLFVGFHQAVHRAVFGRGTTFSVLEPGQVIAVAPALWVFLAALLAAMVCLGLVCARCLRRASLTPACAWLLASCTLVFLWRQGLQPEGLEFNAYTVSPGARPDFGARSDAVSRLQARQAVEPGRVAGIGDSLFPGWSGVYRLEGLSGPDALMNPFYRELTAVGPVPRLWDWRLYLPADAVPKARRFLDFLNVRSYVAGGGLSQPAPPGLSQVFSGDLDLYGSPTAWPRAFFTDRLYAYDKPAELVGQIDRGDGRPFAAALAGDIARSAALSSLPGRMEGRVVVPATHYALAENSTTLQVTAPGPGLLVLSEVNWPHYPHAAVDGVNVPVLRINHAFQGVFIGEPGSHVVSFRYEAPRFPITSGLSALGLALALLGLGLAFTSLPDRVLGRGRGQARSAGEG